MFSLDDLRAVQARLRDFFPETPQYAWPLLARRAGAQIWVKHENHTPVGAFKLRGGLIYMERIAREGLAPRGVISATRGNHGQSLAWAGRAFGVPVVIVVPRGNSAGKNAAMQALGARLIEHGHDFDAARQEAMRLAGEEGYVFAPSFHPDLVRGVATWALELLEAAPLDVLYVPIGLGSSICGAILTRDLLGLDTKIVGVQSEAAPAYALSFAAGRPVETASADTKADGLAVRAPDAEALAIIRHHARDLATVDDGEAIAAMGDLLRFTHNLAEGAGALAWAALKQRRETWRGKRVACVLSGGNASTALMREAMGQ